MSRKMVVMWVNAVAIPNEPHLKIKVANKKGYDEAYEGDSVNMEYPSSTTRRGRVGGGIAQTVDTGNNQGVVVKVMNDNKREKRLGNLYGYAGGNYAYNVYDDDGISPTLNDMQGGGRQPMIIAKRLQKLIDNTRFEEGKVLNMDLYNQSTNGEVSSTLSDPCHNTNRLFDGLRIRKLTPLECWRLMGQSDSAYYKATQVNSDTQLYKQAGNSIVVDVLYYLMKAVFEQNE